MRLSFLDRPLPPAFVLRAVDLPAGGELPFAEDDWRDALVVVEGGELEIECTAGGRRRFPPGAVLWLAGLPLRTLRNTGLEPLRLSAVSRRAMISGRGASHSSRTVKTPAEETSP